MQDVANQRLKLAAAGVYSRIPFVIILIWRRSLGAPREAAEPFHVICHALSL